MGSAEVGLVPSQEGYGEGCPLPSRLWGLGSVVSSQWGPEQSPENGFWRILKATERSFLYTYMTKYEGTMPLLQCFFLGGGTCPPPPVIYAHGRKAKPKPTGRCLLARTVHIISLMIVHTVSIVLRIGLIIFLLQGRIQDFVRGWG